MVKKFNCGFVALVGRPNVGKSTLMNHILNEKISITSHKPQTTRHVVHGIKTTGQTQIIFVDTPGMHTNQQAKMNAVLNRTAARTLSSVDVVVWLVEALVFTTQDKVILQKIINIDKPLIIAINKIDKIKRKQDLLPFTKILSEKTNCKNIVPVSATKKIQLNDLEQEISQYLPEADDFMYDPTIATDKSLTFRTEEIIREQIMRRLNEELPYAITVQVQSSIVTHKNTRKIHAIIWVERRAQKSIVIGHNGTMLKQIGQSARLNLSTLFNAPVYLSLWVKVKSNWSNDMQSLEEFGLRS